MDRRIKKISFVRFFKVLILLFFGWIFGLKTVNKQIKRQKTEIGLVSDRNYVLLRWVKEYEKISRYLQEKKYETIAVYGMGEMGDALVKYLKKMGFKVSKCIDKNPQKVFLENMEVVGWDDDFSGADVIIITVFSGKEKIKKEIQEKTNGKIEILLLEDIIYA